MELHKAIKQIVDTEGPEIINDLRLVNILDDFKAYEDIPASKYILRAIIVDGYANKLLEIGKWDNRAVLLPNKFASITGFIPENVDLIFHSIAYSLGWISTIKISNQKKKGNYQYNDFKRLTKKDQEAFLTDLIYIEPYINSKYGVIINANVSISYSTLYLNVEVSGQLQQDFISFFAAIYNKNGEVKNVKRIFGLDNRPSSASFFCKREFFDGFLKANSDKKCEEYDISKIVIYTDL